MHHSTIAAPVTAPGKAGVAIVRVSGEKTREALAALIKNPSPLLDSPRTMALCEVRDPLSQSPTAATPPALDSALCVFFPQPNSFTGEDCAEFHLHGSPYLVARLLENLSALGVRLARPGEFSQRAYENGRMDLSQAEAVADLIAAETAAQARIAQEQLQGKLRDAVLKLGEPLRDFLAEVEAYIDFPEEDISPLAYSEWLAAVQRVEGEIQGYLSTFRTGRLVREGASVVLLGLPNAGKSSLLNALLGEERAIVTAIPGTTRDTIQEVISLDGMPVRLWDTAGIREGSDEVERLGIERSWKQVDLADLVVFVVEGGAKEEENQKLLREVEQLGRPTLIALNKADLSPALPSFLTASHAPMLTISARTGQGLSELKAAIVQHLTTGAPPSGGLVISHLRHFESLQSASAALVEAVTALEAHHPAEFVALSIRLALSALDDIIGVTSTDEILGRIFSKFCIGK